MLNLRANASALSRVLEQTARISHLTPRSLPRAWACRSAANREPMMPMPIFSMQMLLSGLCRGCVRTPPAKDGGQGAPEPRHAGKDDQQRDAEQDHRDGPREERGDVRIRADQRPAQVDV